MSVCLSLYLSTHAPTHPPAYPRTHSLCLQQSCHHYVYLLSPSSKQASHQCCCSTNATHPKQRTAIAVRSLLAAAVARAHPCLRPHAPRQPQPQPRPPCYPRRTVILNQRCSMRESPSTSSCSCGSSSSKRSARYARVESRERTLVELIDEPSIAQGHHEQALTLLKALFRLATPSAELLKVRGCRQRVPRAAAAAFESDLVRAPRLAANESRPLRSALIASGRSTPRCAPLCSAHHTQVAAAAAATTAPARDACHIIAASAHHAAACHAPQHDRDSNTLSAREPRFVRSITRERAYVVQVAQLKAPAPSRASSRTRDCSIREAPPHRSGCRYRGIRSRRR